MKIHRIALLLAFVCNSHFALAQDVDATKEAKDLMHKAGVQLLVHKNYRAARSLYTQAAEIYKREGGKSDSKYLEAVRGISDCSERLGDDNEAIKGYNAILASKDIWQTDLACAKLGKLYHKAAKIDAAIAVYDMGIGAYHKSQRWTKNFYAIYKDLFYIYFENGDLSNAIRVGTELCSIIRPDIKQWRVLASDLASIHKLAGNHNEALLITQEILSTYYDAESSSSSDNSPSYISEKLLEAIKNNSDKISTTSTSKFNISLTYYELGDINLAIGNYDKATIYFEQAIDVLMSIEDINQFNSIIKDGRRDSLDIYSLLANTKKLLSQCHCELGNKQTSISLAKESFDIISRHATNIETTASIITNYANILLGFKHETEAMQLLNKAISITNNRALIANVYNSLSTIYLENNDIDKALEYAKLATSNDNDPIYLNNLTLCYAQKGVYDQAVEPMKSCWEIVAKEVERLFIQHSEDERNDIWEKYEPLIKAPVNLLWRSNHKEIAKYAYNSTLLTKGVQLSYSIDIREKVYMSGDNELVAAYERWLATPANNPDHATLERELIGRVIALEDYSNRLNIRWDDIRNKLSSNELAIEFIRIPRSDTGEKAYFALLLHREWDAPKSVEICLDNSIESITKLTPKELYESTEIGKLVWGNVVNTIKMCGLNINRIYFVPDGSLYSTAIEYLLLDGVRMNEKYTMYRLASTRDILNENRPTQNNRAALFGGIDYDTSYEEMEYYAYSIPGQRAFDQVWSYLPGTIDEINNIRCILNSCNYKTDSYSGASCIEEVFKSYSHNSPEIIHIATHGFYLPTKDAKTTNTEENTLKRSGLAFAGANNTILGDLNIPDDIDDGILSASEIAKLDLRNTSLVVLSACQTGLGDVRDEGIYGLQRAFKKAGVDSILMTLWSIDDHITQQLITLFYDGLAKGMSKQQALMSAQKKVMTMTTTKSDGTTVRCDDPYYWASFVILD